MGWQDDAIVSTPSAPAPAPAPGGLTRTPQGALLGPGQTSKVDPIVQRGRDVEAAKIIDRESTYATNPDDAAANKREIARLKVGNPKSAAPSWQDDPVASADAPAAADDDVANPSQSRFIPKGKGDLPAPPSQGIGMSRPKPAPTMSDNIAGAAHAGYEMASQVLAGVGGMIAGPIISGGMFVNEGLKAATGQPNSLDNVPNPIEASNAASEKIKGGIDALVKGGDEGGLPGPGMLPNDHGAGDKMVDKYVEPVMTGMQAVTGHLGEMNHITEMAPAAKAQVGEIAKPAQVAIKKASQAVADAGVGKVRSMLGVDPELAKVAETAQNLKYPIDVRPDQIIQNAKKSKLAGEASSDLPLSGSKSDSNATAFTKNVIDLVNPDETADRLTSPIFAKAMERSGKAIGDIYEANPVHVDTLASGIDDIRKGLDDATESDTKIVSSYLRQLEDKAGEDGMIGGTALRELNSEIGERARGGDVVGTDLGRRLNDVQDVIRQGVEATMTDPAQKQALRDYSRQYAYGKMLGPMVAKTIDGQIAPSALMNAVTATKKGKHFMANNMGGPLGDLAKVGQLIKEKGSSMTSERGLVYQLLRAPKEAAKVAGGILPANIYNRAGPGITRMLTKDRSKPMPEAPPPADPTTSLGANPPTSYTPPPGPGPLGDPNERMWSTSPGAGPEGGAGGAVEPTGLVRASDEAPHGNPGPSARRPQTEVPAVEGRPDLPDTMVAGGPAEVAGSDRANAAMNEPGAIEARRQQAAAPATPAEAPPVSDALAEVERLRQGASPAVQKVLDEHVKTLERNESSRKAQIARDKDADALEQAAHQTTDGELQKRLQAQADKLRGGEKIPVGEATEGAPKIPDSKPPAKIPKATATELDPNSPEHKAWQKAFGLGDEDAGRARAVAEALGHNEAAVVDAAKLHESNPQAFQAEIERINAEGQKNVGEAKSSDRSGKGDSKGGDDLSAEGGPEGSGPPDGGDKPPPVRPGSGGGKRGASVQGGDAADAAVPAAKRGADRSASGDASATNDAGNGKPRSVGAGKAESGDRGADASGGQAEGQVTPAEIREVPGGFEAHRDGKRVGYLRDNLERGQAKALDENANVNIVKVNEDELGKGTGRALYQAFNEKHEGRIMPSGKTEPSAWKVWKRDFPEKVDEFVKQEAQRIKDGADAKMIASNVKDPEIIQRINEEASNVPKPKSDDQPGGVRGKEETKGATPKEDDADEVFKEGTKTLNTSDVPGRVNSVGAMDKILRDKFGDKVIDGLREQGILKYDKQHATRGNGIGGSLDQGILSGNAPSATLFARGLTADQVPGVLMHEIGEHFGIVRVLGPRRYQLMLDDLASIRNTPEVKAAWQSVKERYVDGEAGKLNEGSTTFMREVAARLTESAPDLPFVRRMVNEIRAFFYEKFGTTLGNKVDANLVRGLAASALRKASKGALTDMKTPVRVPTTMQPMFRPLPGKSGARPLQ